MFILLSVEFQINHWNPSIPVLGEHSSKIEDLIFISDPCTSIPCLTRLISRFGAFSGYKINMTKSEAMPLGKVTSIPDMSEPFPFQWSPSGFVYLGVSITPTFDKLYKANFPPLFKTIKEDLIRWAPLPLSWLGRIALIKMNVLPRILYPLQMIPVLLTGKVIKELEGWLSSFIWSGRKPRLKLSKLQMAGVDGGLDLPNIRYYQLAAHLRVMVGWLKLDPSSIWLDIESSQSKCPLWNLLFVKDFKTVKELCSNPITLCSVKAWKSIRSVEGRAKLTSPLTPIMHNPDFKPGHSDGGFGVWNAQGLRKLGDLFDGQTLLSFAQLQQRNGLDKSEFFRYLQLRHFITKDTSLLTNSSASQVERILSLQFSTKLISIFYQALLANSSSTSHTTKQAWEKDFGILIDDVDWQEIWTYAKEISICNRTKSIQYRILHRIHITPALKNKMDATASPLCLKCKTDTGNYIHCLWSCVKLQNYWSDIVSELSSIFGVPIDLNPMCLLLGLPDGHLRKTEHKRLFNLLAFAARKNILLFWIKDVAPCKKSWHNIIMDCIPCEYITCMLKSRLDVFYKTWDPYLSFIGHALSAAVLRGFPSRP